MVTTPTSPLLPQRPATPDLGIPMEMTPGQIMEAEISAGLMLDQAESPVFAPESLMSDDLDLDTDADTAHTEFDTVLQTPTQSSHLTEFVASSLDNLPVSTISVTSSSSAAVSIITSDTSSRINLNNAKRRRSDSEEEEPAAKVLRLGKS